MKTLTALAVALLSVAPLAAATPPDRINYQGVLRDAAGNPRTGSFDMVFRLYDMQVGGSLILSDSHNATTGGVPVVVTNGLFSVEIGSGVVTPGTYSTLSAAFGALGSIWLEIQVSAETLSPRLHFASAGYALNAGTLAGQAAGSFVNTSSATQIKTGTLLVGTAPGGPFASLADTGVGVVAKGSNAGGDFRESDTAAYVEAARNGIAIRAAGPTYGAYFGKTDLSGYAYLGHQARGIMAYGTTSGGYFANIDGNTTAELAVDGSTDYAGQFFNLAQDSQSELAGLHGVIGSSGTGSGGFFWTGVCCGILGPNVGIEAYGGNGGGYFYAGLTAASATVATGSYKITGAGSVAFIQNHPSDEDRVIVYNAPEGDEVATYTRGSARLVRGEARIPLGETFAWVTNPDLGLTAYVTPVGEWADLYVASKTTKELVVRSRVPDQGPVELDYIVYGLRIGFEETSIVQEKTQEAFIPSMASHRKRYEEHPELRRFNALEQDKVERERMGHEAAPDLRASRALRESIHEYDHAVDQGRVAEANARFGRQIPESARRLENGSVPVPDAARSEGAAAPALNGSLVAPSRSEDSLRSDEDPRGLGAAPVPSGLAAPQGVTVSMSVGEAVEAGDVLAFDPERPGMLRRSTAADPGVAGVVAEGTPEVIPGEGLAPVTVVGIAMCKVDAGYGAIRAGDLLVASPTAGHAMRTLEPAPGTILGKAVDSLDAGTGRIRVLVMTR